MFSRTSYREYDKEALIDELEQITNENRELKIRLYNTKNHLHQYQEFVNKYEKSLTEDIGVPQEEFLSLDIPF